MQVKILKDAVTFTPIGDPVGNLSIGRGVVQGVNSGNGGSANCYVAIVENKIASGSLGTLECQRLASLFMICMREKAALVLYLDSAGAKVSEGHVALGAFRKLFKQALQLSAQQIPVVTILGTNCYGGASMLAQAGQICLFGAHTKMAMSGPTILAQASGADVFDATFQAIAQAAISGAARAAQSPRNRVLAATIDAKGLAQTLESAFAEIAAEPNWQMRRMDELHARAGKLNLAPAAMEAFKRPDCDKLFPEGYQLQVQNELVFGTANYNGHAHDVIGIAAPGLRTLGSLGVASAWAFAQRAYALAQDLSGKPCIVLLDCESHSTQIADEKPILSAYLHHLAHALQLLAHSRIAQQPGGLPCIVLNRAGGGVFVAFAAACKTILLYKAQIQLLPASAISNILGNSSDAAIEFAEICAAGVADEELKIGYIAP
jgi:Carboxyl transferase domain/Malonate decarboxylase gamma subunit (MdcE)